MHIMTDIINHFSIETYLRLEPTLSFEDILNMGFQESKHFSALNDFSGKIDMKMENSTLQ